MAKKTKKKQADSVQPVSNDHVALMTPTGIVYRSPEHAERWIVIDSRIRHATPEEVAAAQNNQSEADADKGTDSEIPSGNE